MKIALVIIVGAGLGVATNLVSNFVAPHVKKRKRLVISTTVFLIALSIGIALLPTAGNDSQQVMPPTISPNIAALSVGQTWQVNGAEITLESLKPLEDKDKIFAEWTIKNVSNRAMPFKIDTSKFYAFDEHGIPLKVIGLGAQYSVPSSEIEVVLNPSHELKLWLAIEFDITYSSSRTATIVLRNIFETEQPAWRSKIPFH